MTAALASAAGLGAFAGTAQAGIVAPPGGGETAVAVTRATSGPQTLRTFDTLAPQIVSEVQVTGLANGEKLVGIDVRPATSELYGVGRRRSPASRASQSLYTIDPNSGAAVRVGPLTAPLGAGSFGVDFNPTVDRLRINSTFNRNLRVNPTAGMEGATTVDTNLQYAGGDVNAGKDPDVVGAGYTNSVAGASSTTLYDLDLRTKSLVTQTPANAGTLQTVGKVGLNFAANAGFDISGATGTAYAALTNLSQSPGSRRATLRTIDLTTGQQTLVGQIGDGRGLDGLAILPGGGGSETLAR